jgi:hypothetical protein
MRIKRKAIISLLVVAGFLFGNTTSMAQRRVVKSKAKKIKLVTKKTPTNTVFNSLLPSTAKLMFIDSMVVAKDSFPQYLPLCKDMGRLTFKDSIATYTNELQTRRLFAQGDSMTGRYLYGSDKTGKNWAKPRRLGGIGDEFTMCDFPYLMSDGVTLYFAAQSSKNVGKLDIFMTRYNSDEGEFFEPENCGLPYNSDANDYLLAIDDMNQLGWLVSDRFQPEGKVCIYTFEPTAVRMGFAEDNLSDRQIEKYARLTSISDTWQFGDRDKALARLEKLTQAQSREASNKSAICFVINDRKTYRSMSDFKNSDARACFVSLQKAERNLSDMIAELNTLRDKYAAGNHSVAQTILTLEKETNTLQENINKLTKEIRRLEQ